MSKKQLCIGALIQAYGIHAASWLAAEPASPGAMTDIDYFIDMAQRAEAAKFDFFFLADSPAMREGDLEAWSRSPVFMNQLEPITLLTALAHATRKIGLAGTASTTFYEPYNLARLYASLDHISKGRAGWNIVTTANEAAAKNFGLSKLPPHDRRYTRAREFYSVMTKLWDTWEDDAWIYDRTSGLTFDPAKLHATSHQGEFFRVESGLNMARPPQGYPVIIQAGASDEGRELAAETAEVVFGIATNIDSALKFYTDQKGRMAKYGRHPDEMKILSGALVVVGDTLEDAQQKEAALQAMVHESVTLVRIKQDIETDLSDLPLDAPVPLHRLPEKANLHSAYFNQIKEMVIAGKTLRQICKEYTRTSATIMGTPEQIADQMQEWLERGACDGFMLMFPVLPASLDDFAQRVVPLLQARGIFREDYTGNTFRENLGLARPENQYVKARALEKTA